MHKNLKHKQLLWRHHDRRIGILETHLKDRGFCSDMEPLLRHGISYDPQAAGKYVIANLLNLLQE